jgi:sulfide:quinone oxidoreductase
MPATPHIVILGAGFAALTAVRELRKRSPHARISLVAPKAEFVYLPSLIWIPSGLRKGSDLILPLKPSSKTMRRIHRRPRHRPERCRPHRADRHRRIQNDA